MEDTVTDSCWAQTTTSPTTRLDFGPAEPSVGGVADLN